MLVFDWLFSIEGRTVLYIGSNSLKDLRNAITGFLEAQSLITGESNGLIFYDFQKYIQKVYGIAETAEGWNTIITNQYENDEQAMQEFYRHLHDYCDSRLQNG